MGHQKRKNRADEGSVIDGGGSAEDDTYIRRVQIAVGSATKLGWITIPNNELLQPVNWISDDCKKYWNDAVVQMGPELEEHLKLFLSEFGSILNSTTGFGVRVVVDTNAALSETKRLMKNKSPFLTKLARSPFLELLAPTELLDELTEKIRELYPNQMEQAKAFQIARSIVKGIRIVRGFQINARVKAEALMGERDPDDVVFVQIAIEYDTHGVISKDKAFMELGEIKRWELGEVGRVITELNRGALTLWVTARGLPLAALVFIKLGMMIVSLAFAAMEQLTDTAIGFIERGVSAVIDYTKQNPLLTGMAVGGVVLLSFLLLSWEPSRIIIDNIVEQGKIAIEQMVMGATAAFDQIAGSIEVLVKASKDQLPALVDWFDCLVSSSVLLSKRIEELNLVKV